ncbi:MAG: ankyrin repeat domain-containing protein, partial [Betaproteobacteria bacterium]|nr:ankyrin repeat domain-containing protein [Betaproteobacteria bacterium]
MRIFRFASGLSLMLLAILAPVPVHASAYDDMQVAIRNGNESAVMDLLRRGMDVDTVNPQGETLLMMAAREGKPAVVRALLAGMARLQARSPIGESALMLAAIHGHAEVVRMLLDAGAPVNQPGWTALIYAATRNRVDIARLLIARGAEVNAAADNGITALMM